MASVTFVELLVAEEDVPKTKAFYETVFDWDMQPFGEPGYFIQSHGDEPGIDVGLGKSQDGTPVLSTAVTVPDIDEAIRRVEANGGQVVVPKFEIPGVGQLGYFKDPNGFIIGLHQRPT